MNKITVIGAGNVGSAVANNLLAMGIATEIVLIDANKEKAFGEAMDIYQGISHCSPAIVRSGDYSAATGSSIVVITSGAVRKPDQSRLDLIETNVKIITSIASQITVVCPKAIYIIVSDPVDVITYIFHKISGIPEAKIIGSGTALDTARLQAELARQLKISPRNVHAHVYGAHGDSSFVPWSLATIANNPIDHYKNSVQYSGEIEWDGDHESMERFVHGSGTSIVRSKGTTFYDLP